MSKLEEALNHIRVCNLNQSSYIDVFTFKQSLVNLESGSSKNAAVQPNNQKFHSISADVTDPSECIRVLKEVKVWNKGEAPDIVWCIAGSSYPGFFLHFDAHRLREQMNQNYWSAAFMAHATLREWLQPLDNAGAGDRVEVAALEPRHLIFTSSLVSFYPIVGYTAYAPGKAALRSLSDALSQEIKLYNGSRQRKPYMGPAADVRVHTVVPGTIYSPGYEQENLTKPAITVKLEEGDQGQTEDQVAMASFKGLQRGEFLITTTTMGAIMRGAAWGGSPRHDWVLDTIVSWVASIAWLFVQPELDGKVTNWGAKKGHPATY